MGKDNRIIKKSKFKTTKGVEYKVLFRKPDARWFDDADGYCQDPNSENPKILVNPYLTDQSELNTIIHEIGHAFFWDKTEKEIAQFANTCSRILYERGFAHNTKRNPKRKKRNK